MTDGQKKRMAAAHSPEARAKRAATMARKKAERNGVQSIPLSAIPEDKPKPKPKAHPDVMTKEKAAFEIIRLTTWLAQH